MPQVRIITLNQGDHLKSVLNRVVKGTLCIFNLVLNYLFFPSKFVNFAIVRFARLALGEDGAFFQDGRFISFSDRR